LHFHTRPELLGTMSEGLLAVSPDGAILGANRAALQQLGTSAAAVRIQGLEAVLGVSVGTIIDHCRRRGDEPLKLMLRQADGTEQPVSLRAFFNWPTLWPSKPTELTAPPGPPPAAPAPVAGPIGSTLEAIERDTIRRAVAAAGGNLSQAARQLGIGRNTLYRKLRKATSASD
jgi:transcriptional regulator of acetoin/glycerol metabolism